MLRQNLSAHDFKAWLIDGTPTFAVDNPHTVKSALNGMRQKIHKDFLCRMLIHVVQINLIRCFVVAPAKPLEDALLIARAQEMQICVCIEWAGAHGD
jgi:hypothetical protein